MFSLVELGLSISVFSLLMVLSLSFFGSVQDLVTKSSLRGSQYSQSKSLSGLFDNKLKQACNVLQDNINLFEYYYDSSTGEQVLLFYLNKNGKLYIAGIGKYKNCIFYKEKHVTGLLKQKITDYFTTPDNWTKIAGKPDWTLVVKNVVSLNINYAIISKSASPPYNKTNTMYSLTSNASITAYPDLFVINYQTVNPETYEFWTSFYTSSANLDKEAAVDCVTAFEESTGKYKYSENTKEGCLRPSLRSFTKTIYLGE